MSYKVRPQHTTRAVRTRRQWWIRTAIWVFLIVFAFSVVGGLMIFAQSSSPSP